MKILLAILFTIILSSSPIFAQESDLFSWDIGISTGIPFHYGESNSNISNFDANTLNRVLAGTTSNIYIKIADTAFVNLGIDSLFDFKWNASDYANSIDYTFFGGVKIYPGLGGLNFSIAYCFGSRSDFLKINDEKDIFQHSWGNGARFSLEYDFNYLKATNIKPIVGGYYRFIPRGNYVYDHILCAYIALKF